MLTTAFRRVTLRVWHDEVEMTQIRPLSSPALLGCAGLALALAGLFGCDIELEPDDEPLRDGEPFVLEPLAVGAAPPDFLAGDDDYEDGYNGGILSRCLPPDAEPMDPPMVATPGPGQIVVQHEGIVTSVAPEWFVHGMMNQADGTIEIVYEEQAVEPPLESCTWRFEYVIVGVPEGIWTLTARQDTAAPVEVWPDPLADAD
jgi:hypothetical protein